jgi:hypothetical protein
VLGLALLLLPQHNLSPAGAPAAVPRRVYHLVAPVVRQSEPGFHAGGSSGRIGCGRLQVCHVTRSCLCRLRSIRVPWITNVMFSRAPVLGAMRSAWV